MKSTKNRASSPEMTEPSEVESYFCPAAVTEEVMHCSRQCPYPTPQKPPVKFGTISKLLRRKDEWNSVLNMETAHVATTLLKRTANILVHRGKRKKKCLLCYKPMVLKMRTCNNSLLMAPLLFC